MNIQQANQTESQSDNEYAFHKSERFILDFNSPVPLYHQVEQIILDRISKPEMVNRKLPSEPDLTKVFDVSRATVKKALDNIINKGWLARRRGLSTRVATPHVKMDVTHIKSHYDQMRSQNLEVRTKVLQVGLHRPASHIAERLGLKSGERTLLIRRIRGTTETYPVYFTQTDLLASFGIDPKLDFSSRSLYEILEKDYGILIIWAEEVIRAAKASPEEAKYLEISPDDVVLVSEKVTYTTNDRPLEFARTVFRADRYEHVVRSVR